jgi:hypothetical protein
MSDIIDAIRQGAGQVLSEIDQKGQLKSAFDGIRHQLSELERRRKANSLEGELKALQAEMKQLTEALGLQTLSLFDAGKVTHPELARLCERINELRADIEGKKAQLESLVWRQMRISVPSAEPNFRNRRPHLLLRHRPSHARWCACAVPSAKPSSTLTQRSVPPAASRSSPSTAKLHLGSSARRVGQRWRRVRASVRSADSRLVRDCLLSGRGERWLLKLETS